MNREESISDSITRFDWHVKIKSTHEEGFSAKWIGSLINCYKPNWDVIASVSKPSS